MRASDRIATARLELRRPPVPADAPAILTFKDPDQFQLEMFCPPNHP